MIVVAQRFGTRGTEERSANTQLFVGTWTVYLMDDLIEGVSGRERNLSNVRSAQISI
jgi:hypothetical protein